MTQEQKLEIVYKKLFTQRAFTKEGTQFFEEPFSTFSQVPLSHLYVNSDWIPNTAPNSTITIAGIETLKYVDKETTVGIDSTGTKFVTGNGKIIPTSYGIGYGIELRTQSGEVIDPVYFPYVMDWESGEIYFDNVPFDVDFYNPPLASYHYYSGKTLETIQTFTQQGPRGNIGPTGETGPIDTSVMAYRGKTDFSISPAVQYFTNDVITFTTNGNSYICLSDTVDSPTVSPASWENISPSGSSGQIPENVLYVNHPDAIPTSSLKNGSPFYFTSLQDAIDFSPNGVATTIIVNQLNNQHPISESNITIDGKVLNVIFRNWANVSSEQMQLNGFAISIVDSDVVIEGAQVGGNMMFKLYPAANEILISANESECKVKFVDCRINSKLILAERNAENNCEITFERCSINSERFVTNCDTRIIGSTFSGSVTADYSQGIVFGNEHVFEIVNSFGFQRAMNGSLRNVQTYDVIIVVDRGDLQNCKIKLENSFLPAVGVVFTPETFLYSPDEIRLDVNNCIVYNMGLEESSAKQGGIINVVGSNVLYAINFNNFPSQFFTLDDPYNVSNGVFLFSIDDPAGNIPVVTWDQTTMQKTNAYDAYKSLAINDVERFMTSL
jgi:hypothetical protein